MSARRGTGGNEASVKPTRIAFERRGLGYAARFPQAGAEMTIDRLIRVRGELRGEIVVERLDPDVYEGALLQASFNVSSFGDRERAARYLGERSNGFDWTSALEIFCTRVLREEQTGQPFETVGQLPPAEGVRFLLWPVLPTGRPTIVYGEGGAGKSTYAAAVAVSVAAGVPVVQGWRIDAPGQVLIIDWEADEREWNDRIAAVSKGIGIDPPVVHYREGLASLPDQLHELAQHIAQHDIALLIIDSVGLAMPARGDGADANDGALRLFKALRHLGVTSLLIDHVAGADMGSEKVVTKPYGCYSADTEVLTRRGWLRHAEMTRDDDVLGFADGILRWERPTHHWAYDHDGEMVHLKNQATDALVTENHRLLVRPAVGSGTWRYHEAGAMPSADWTSAVSGEPPDGPDTEHSDDLIRLIGWMVAEGSVQHGRLRLGQSLGAFETQITSTLDRLGIAYWRKTYTKVDRKPFAHIVTRRTPLAGLFPGVASTKRLPDLTWRLSLRQRRLLLETLIAGDGHLLPSGAAIYTTASPGLADDVQRLGVLCGLHAIVRCRRPLYHGLPRESWQVSLIDRRVTHWRPSRVLSSLPYTGRVYCLTVPAGAYVTRRNGQVSIHGNSVYKFNLARNIFELRAAAQDPDGTRHIGVYHRKANATALFPPQGYAVHHGPAELLFQAEELEAAEANAAIPLHSRIHALLLSGGRAPKAIAEALNAQPNNVRATLTKMKAHGMVTQLPGKGNIWAAVYRGTTSEAQPVALPVAVDEREDPEAVAAEDAGRGDGDDPAEGQDWWT